MALRAVSTVGATGGVSGTLPAFYQDYPNASLTGTLTETTLAPVRVPANSMGPKGLARLTLIGNVPNNANSKTVLVKASTASGGTGGTFVGNPAAFTTVGAFQLQYHVRNANATGTQLLYTTNATTPFGTTGGGTSTLTIDTTADFYLNINGVLGNVADTIALLGWTLEIFHA